jgi:hypothetical protein
MDIAEFSVRIPEYGNSTPLRIVITCEQIKGLWPYHLSGGKSLAWKFNTEPSDSECNGLGQDTLFFTA